MKNILILEDNKSAIEKLEYIINDINQKVNVYAAENVIDAYTYSMEINIDLFLIDIVLETRKSGDVSGLEFVRKIRRFDQYKFIPIIMITSLEDPRMYSYSEIHCYSYIEKPYDMIRLKKIIEEALEYKRDDSIHKKYMFRREGIIYAIDIENIIYIESINRKMKIITEEEEIAIPYISFKNLLAQINDDRFIQCSKYCVVNRRFIERIDGVNRYLKLKNISEEIEIGASIKKRFIMELRDV